MEQVDTGFPALNLRFIGPNLDTSNLPIYDLGVALVAVQKLIHKGHLTSEGRFEKGKKLSKRNRIDLSLQIGGHKKSSDFYSLVPFLSDPANHEALKASLGFLFSALKIYAEKRVKSYFESDQNENRKQFVCNIYGDVTNLVNRVGAGGGSESIQITVPAYSPDPIVIDESVRDYVREIGHQVILGAVTTIRGPVQKMYTASKIVTIFINGSKKCSIFMNKDQFDQVRYDQADRPYLVVTGRPRYRLDQEQIFEEFEAMTVSFSFNEHD
nr:hypothetical protein [uncultured Holophaga sp.]